MSRKKFKFLSFILAIWQFIFCRIIRLVFLIFKDLKVYGRENLKEYKKPLIYAANHSNELDPFLFGGMIPIKKHPMYILTRPMEGYTWKGIKKFLYRDSTLNLLGVMPTNSGINNYEESLKKHIKILKNGESVLIFPEGKKTKDGRINQARGGVSYLSYKTKVPVVPVGISGVWGLNIKDFFFKKRKITINFGEPVKLWEYLPKDREPSVDELRYVANRLMRNKIANLVDIPNVYEEEIEPAKA